VYQSARSDAIGERAMQSIRESIIRSVPASKVWCTDGFEFGVIEQPKHVALAKKHIQINPHHAKAWMSFDVDRAGAAFAFDDLHIEPTLTVINPINKHAHHHIRLNKPVFMADAKAMAYYNDVRKALAFVLRADLSYSGFVTKNPLSHHHHALNSLETRAIAYELHDLVEALPCSVGELVKEADRLKQKQIESGIGRNCYLFDELRAWAYNNVRHYRENPSSWLYDMQAQALLMNNAHGLPLGDSELQGIVRSVGRYVCPNSHKDKQHAKAFSDTQKCRAIIGVEHGNLDKANAARLAFNEDKQVTARLLSAQGKSARAIAGELGIHYSTVSRWLKNGV
jgi:hypothetical protein